MRLLYLGDRAGAAGAGHVTVRRSRSVAGAVALGLTGVFAVGCTPEEAVPGAMEVEARLRALADSAGGEVAVYYRDLEGRDSILLSPDLRMHAASTMKVPVMIQLFRDRDDGRLTLEDPVAVQTTFHSIVDGSPYDLPATAEGEPGLHGRLGEDMPVRELVEHMITRSSNLATNLLIRLADAERVTTTMRALGADSIEVLRGVEDMPAFEAGLSNTTTARDLGVIFTALARGGAASEVSTREMLAILERQEHRSKIPAGLPPGTRVANKTGRITAISHDAAVVLPEGATPYVLVVLTRGFDDGAAADALAARITGIVHEHHLGLDG